ncbi:MAG TPA: lysozyme inhibitor LprI family protein [Chthoniobacterales bacterium]|jgi:uncharacterized protein YecT (DUF1311 family)
MSFRALLIAVFLCAAASLDAQTKSKIIPADWLPALAPSIKSTLDQLRDASSQAEMNRLSREVADMTDAQLFIAYVRLYEKLPPKERETLFEEQAAWLEKRPSVAKKAVESKGGSLAPLEANNAELTYSEKRLAELRARLKTAGAKKKSTSTDEEE